MVFETSLTELGISNVKFCSPLVRLITRFTPCWSWWSSNFHVVSCTLDGRSQKLTNFETWNHPYRVQRDGARAKKLLERWWSLHKKFLSSDRTPLQLRSTLDFVMLIGPTSGALLIGGSLKFYPRRHCRQVSIRTLTVESRENDVTWNGNGTVERFFLRVHMMTRLRLRSLPATHFRLLSRLHHSQTLGGTGKIVVLFGGWSRLFDGMGWGK